MLRLFDTETETPELIWDGEMRGELRNSLASVLDEVFDGENSAEKRGERWDLEGGFRVKYAKLADELYIGGVYVRLFLKEPTYNLRDPTGFLEMVMKRWAEELTVLTGGGVGGGGSGGGGGGSGSGSGSGGGGGDQDQLTAAKQDTLQLVTSAAVYLCKVRAPLCDKLAAWGYMSQAVNFISNSLNKGMRGSPLVSCVRVLHVGGSRRNNVEAIALSDKFVEFMKQAVLDNDKKLHQDAAFMVECLKKVFADALGEVDNVMEVTPMPAAAAAEGGGVTNGFTNDGAVNAMSAPKPEDVAKQQMGTVGGAPNAAHGRVSLLNLALKGGLCKFLVEEVLDNESCKLIVDPAAIKVHAVALVKLLAKDPGYGMQFSLVLGGIDGWKKYKDQDHALFITGTEQRADYFLTNSSSRAEEKMLTAG